MASESPHSQGTGFDLGLPKDFDKLANTIKQLEEECCIIRTYQDWGHWTSCSNTAGKCTNKKDWEGKSCSDRNYYPFPSKSVQDVEKDARQVFCDKEEFCEPVFDLVKP